MLHQLRRPLSFLDYHRLFNRVTRSKELRKKPIKKTHARKLNNLGIAPKNSVNKDKVVINLNKRILTESEKDVLSFSLSFGLPKWKIDYVQHYFCFDKILSSLKKLNSDNFKDVIQFAHNSFKDFPKLKSSYITLLTNLFDASKSLRSENSIVISRSDKGGAQ